MDDQLKTVYVCAGETTEITWKNTAITGQIQIYKTSEDYNSTNGWAAGTPLPDTVFEIYSRSGNLVDTVKTNKNGIAISEPLPLGRYWLVESQASPHYSLDRTPLEVEIEFEGQIVRVALTNMCFDSTIDAEKFASEKSAIFLILPEEDTTKNFMAGLMIQNLSRELFAVADENGGRLKNRVVLFCDEFGTMPPFDILPLFSAGRSHRLTLVPIIQSLAQLEKNYGKEGCEIIQDNCRATRS